MGYDKNNNVDKLTILSGGRSYTDNYTYGKDNLPEKYTHSSGKSITYEYDGLNRLTSKTLDTASPISSSLIYDQSARNAEDETLYTTSRIKTETLNDAVYDYTYDSRGNLTQITRRGEQDAVIQTYAYDGMNQLTEDFDHRLGIRRTFSYDQNGNMIQRGEFWDGYPPSYFEFGYNDPQWPDKLTHIDGEESFQYDEIGNPTLWFDNRMEWEGRRLVKLWDTEYAYDDAGLRTSKTFGNGETHSYEYLGGKLMVERRSDVTLYFSYDALGSPAALTRVFTDGRTDTHYYLVNSFGDVTALYDAEGNLAARYHYDAWGVDMSGFYDNDLVIGPADSLQHMNPLRYRGYYYDTESTYYYLQSRYYDPTFGRFINADDQVINDHILGTNMFVYCYNNPVMLVDPSGHKPGDWFATEAAARADFERNYNKYNWYFVPVHGNIWVSYSQTYWDSRSCKWITWTGKRSYVGWTYKEPTLRQGGNANAKPVYTVKKNNPGKRENTDIELEATLIGLTGLTALATKMGWIVTNSYATNAAGAVILAGVPPVAGILTVVGLIGLANDVFYFYYEDIEYE